ncbi:MAG: hypothetical protein BACD_00133 [Bacteroides rodentium]
MNRKISLGTILVTAVLIIFAAYALGLLDPVIEWIKESLTLESQTHGMIEQILR